MTTILEKIIAHKKLELAQRQDITPIDAWLELAKPKDNANAYIFERVLREPHEHIHIIGEIKPKSPSAGVIQDTINVDAIVTRYDEFVSGISVLTDKEFFGGGFDLLQEVRSKTTKPLLCKEFIIDLYQVLLAVHSGADAALLIMKCLDEIEYISLFESIRSYGLTPIVEVQTYEELQRALLPRPPVILINNRNLDTFVVDMSTTTELAKRCPEGTIIISASGFESIEHCASMKGIAHATLIGTSLMRGF